MSDVQIFPTDVLSFHASAHQTGYYLRLAEAIRSARINVQTCQYVFSTSPSRPWQRSNKIMGALKDANLRGVSIQALFDRPKAKSPNLHSNITTARALADAGITPRCLAVTKTLHIKLIIVDHKFFFAGSHNLTNSSLYSPFELSFECHDPFMTNAAVVYFNCLWNGPLSENFFDALRRVGIGEGQ
jgi:phosphatidylserine/phosphatidylglycerophosphate/cardiolipin synthase-like enzyme